MRAEALAVSWREAIPSQQVGSVKHCSPFRRCALSGFAFIGRGLLRHQLPTASVTTPYNDVLCCGLVIKRLYSPSESPRVSRGTLMLRGSQFSAVQDLIVSIRNWCNTMINVPREARGDSDRESTEYKVSLHWLDYLRHYPFFPWPKVSNSQ